LRARVSGLGRSVEDFGAEYVVRPEGGMGHLTEAVDAWRDAGGTHVSVVTMGLGLSSVEDHIDYIAAVARALELS
jgi:L-arabinose isomerase